MRDKLLTGTGVGLAAGLGIGAALDGGLGVPIYACVGGILGLLCGAYLEGASRAPFWTAAALLCAAPLCLPLGALVGLPAFGELPALLAAPLAVTLLRRRDARDLIVANALTSAVAVYCAVTLLAVVTRAQRPTLVEALETLLPFVAFSIGMTLHVPPPAAETTEETPDDNLAGLAPDTSAARVRLIPLLGWGVSGAGLLLALGVDATALFPSGSAPALLLAQNRSALANTLALLVLVALFWDSRRAYWSALLGQPARWRRLAVGVVGAAYLVALVTAFTLIGSRSVLLALGVTVVAVYTLRRGLTTFAPLAAITLALLALFGNGGVWLNLHLTALGRAFSGYAWHQALDAAAMGPFGATAPSNAATLPQSLYLATLRTAGLPGLMALTAVLGVTLALSRRAYRALRANDAQTGSALVAGGCALYLLIGGLTSDPLRAAPAAFLFWLLLGRANAIFAHVGSGDEAHGEERDEMRGYPLRVVHMTVGNDAGETPPALLESFHTLERAHVTSLLISRGDGPLAQAAPDADVVTRVVPTHDPTALDLAAVLASSPFGLLRRLGATRLGAWLCVRCDALGSFVASAREWRLLAHATLELRPDLVVSASPETHLPALLAGRLAGAPVLWHTRDIAPRRLQRLHDALLSWTSGVLVPSQTAAHAYQPWPAWAFARWVRVLRPGIALPEPLVEDQRNELRRALGVPRAYPLLAVVGPLSPASGLRIALDAILQLQRHYPDLHVIIASERLDDGHAETQGGTLAERVGARWLREAVTAAELDPCVTHLGARGDAAALLAAADVAVFPAQNAPMSRSLLLALAQGTPIVAARSGALAEQLSEAWGHEMYDPGNAARLSHAVESVVERLPRYRTDARRNPGLTRDWGAAWLEQARLLSIYRELCMPASRLQAPWPRKKAANLPKRWLAALWAGVGRGEEHALEQEPEREDLAAVAADAPAGDQTWVSIGA